MNRTLVLTLLAAVVAAVAVALLFGDGRPPRPTEDRFVSLSPAITQAIHALEAEDRLVGRSAYDGTPARVARLPSAGTALTPDREAIATMRPSHILLEQLDGGAPSGLSRLAEVVVLPWRDAAEASQSVAILGDLVGRPEAAARLSERYRRLASPEPIAEDAPRVLLALGTDDLGSGELWYIAADTIHGRALTAAGFRHAIPGDADGPPRITAERLVLLDPDVILVLRNDADLPPELAENAIHAFDRFETLTAVRNGHIGVLSGPEILATGPDVLDLPARLEAAVAQAVAAPDDDAEDTDG